MTDFPETLCVGMHFRGQGAVDAASLLTPEQPLTLVREPENPYDEYAIKVLLGDMHIGYIERSKAAWISPLVDEGRQMTAELTGHHQKGKNNHPILLIRVSDA